MRRRVVRTALPLQGAAEEVPDVRVVGVPGREGICGPAPDTALTFWRLFRI